MWLAGAPNRRSSHPQSSLGSSFASPECRSPSLRNRSSTFPKEYRFEPSISAWLPGRRLDKAGLRRIWRMPGTPVSSLCTLSYFCNAVEEPDILEAMSSSAF